MSKTAAKVTKEVNDVAEATNEAFKDGVERSMAAVSELTSMSKQGMEAWVESATATQRGFEAINARVLAYSKKAMEDGVAAAKSLSGARSLQDVMELQTTYAKSAFETYVAEMTKLAEISSGVAKDAIKPLNERAAAVATMIQASK